jgi:hypothetical protein
MATFFAIIAFVPLLRSEHDTVRWWAVMVSALFLALALFWTAPLRPLNWLWTRFGDLLNRLVSPIAIGLLFYLAVMPTGLVRRALGKDLLCVAIPQFRAIGFCGCRLVRRPSR